MKTYVGEHTKSQLKNSFRTLLILSDGRAFVITQDARRRKNIITGCVKLAKLLHAPLNSYNAKSFGCNIIVRQKS